jgi:hypothetical protein
VRLVQRVGQRPLSVPLLCARCASGDHSRLHTEIGCTSPVMLPPFDLICRCEEPPAKRKDVSDA